ncbi:glycoside hydrolase [Pseudodesulfovibrio sp. JC047]|uniref:SH3 domain-containing C40 family peptidase n=1 Tax=Pseudodesulfovibrio sp. JC047 TaxID=2683199 RepID=UPI0013D3CD21|nr:SH3 domain-containing C40 family peptidase [Pseudodesulfovibrio sp. JC047]NDV18153.1 glycoside hydrolase [Pseudodesulfovibrio sp. JC047]
MIRQAIFFILTACLLAGCAAQDPNAPILDLTELPQDAGVYHDLPETTPLIPPTIQKQAFDQFLKAHFGPWEQTEPRHPASEAFWGLDVYDHENLYGENTLPRDPRWIRDMTTASRVEAYPSMGRRAIAVATTSMRVLPTNRPVFHDFSKAGEGFPFDYMQNSLVLAGTPLYAAHVSADTAWILVESRFAFGWVPARDIAWVDDDFASTYQTGSYATPITDAVAIVDETGNYAFTARVGMMIPREPGTPDIGLIPVRDRFGHAVALRAKLPVGTMAQAPLPATPANFSALANTMLGQQYGWGGLYENRDCSATTMDLMAAFGIFLPRNSSQQAKMGTPFALDGLDLDDKKETILDNATPFLTLVRKPGHIMLYIGNHDGEPIVFHSVWGVKTEVGDGYGRKIIGATAITTLEPGRELDTLAAPLLDSVTRITTLP